TLNVAVDDVLSVIKTWQPHELRRIDEAVAAAQKPLVAFLSLDDEEALMAQLRQYGVRELATIRAPGHGKMFPSGDAQSVYFDEILTKLRVSDAVVRNPGIEDLMRSAESARGAVVLVSRHHEAGQKLEALGGIAALLRFPIK